MPQRRTTPEGYALAKRLREEPTPAEGKLWAYLRGRKLKGFYFRRQHAIGIYVVDFCAINAKMIIELDGSQHIDQQMYDAKRTAFLETKGYRVLRFWNSDVMNNVQGVLGMIMGELDNSTEIDTVTDGK